MHRLLATLCSTDPFKLVEKDGYYYGRGPLARRAVGNNVPTGGSVWTFPIMPE